MGERTCSKTGLTHALGNAREKRTLLCTCRGANTSEVPQVLLLWFPSKQPFFLTTTGSPTMAGYYGIKRSFTAELDLHNTKQFVSDVYSSPLGSKPFSCDSSATQDYPTLLDPYLTNQYGDYRATPLTAGTSSFFSPSSVPPLLPPFPNDTAHLLLVSESTVLSQSIRAYPI